MKKLHVLSQILWSLALISTVFGCHKKNSHWNADFTTPVSPIIQNDPGTILLAPAFLEAKGDLVRESINFNQFVLTLKNNGQRAANEITGYLLNETANESAGDITKQDSQSQNLQFEGGSFPGRSGTCSTILEPNSECKIVFEVKPNTDLAKVSAHFKISYFSGISSQIFQFKINSLSKFDIRHASN